MIDANEKGIRHMDVVRPAILSTFAGITAAVSTRSGGVSPEPLGMNMSYNVGDAVANVRTNRERFVRHIGAETMMLATTTQVHGETVLRITEGGKYPACDALITATPGILLAVSIADCVPVLLVDPVRGVVAAVHAGWRGTHARIVVRTVASMAEGFGSHPPDLVAYVGPSAGRCCYEVGEEVAGLFEGKYADRSRGPKPFLDVRMINAGLLVQSGLDVRNIEISTDCTICSDRRFHSFRRDGKSSGRMWAVVGKC
jgi:YfiH family protein